MSSAKCFHRAVARHAAAFVSLFYGSCILFLLFVVTVSVKFVLLRIALELLLHLQVRFLLCKISFPCFISASAEASTYIFPSGLWRKVFLTLCSSKIFFFLFCLLSDHSHFPYSDHTFCSLPTALLSLPNVVS